MVYRYQVIQLRTTNILQIKLENMFCFATFNHSNHLKSWPPLECKIELFHARAIPGMVLQTWLWCPFTHNQKHDSYILSSNLDSSDTSVSFDHDSFPVKKLSWYLKCITRWKSKDGMTITSVSSIQVLRTRSALYKKTPQ